MRIISLLPLTILLLIAACTPTTTIRHTADFQQKLSKNTELAVLPADAALATVDVVGHEERIPAYEAHISDMLSKEVLAAFQSRGYRAKQPDIQSLNLADALRTLHEQHKRVILDLYRPYSKKETEAFAIHALIGESPIEIGKKSGSELLVLASYSVSVKTNGARARDFALDLLIGTQNTANVDDSFLSISVIDGTTGEIIWSNMAREEKDLYRSAVDNLSALDKIDAERISRLLTQVLAPLPRK